MNSENVTKFLPMRPQNGSFWKSRRDWRHGQKKSEWHASPHWLPQSQARSERDREREREREREWGRERERERESDRERERETDANPPQRGIPIYETNLTQEYFQGVILQHYENELYKIEFRRIIYGKLHIRHVIPEKIARNNSQGLILVFFSC